MPTFDFSATPVLRIAVNAWIADQVAAEEEYGHIKDWDTSDIDNMSGLFQDKDTFNDDISQWDTSNVTSMADMFNGAEAFNQDISGWNTSKVTNMGWMFKNSKHFNQDIRKWDVSKVHTFTNMFAGDVAFQDTYGVPNTPVAVFFSQFDSDALKAAVVEHFQDAAAAEAKYGKLTKYDTSLVTDMSMLFRDRVTFNLDISGWNTGNVTQFEQMFNGAEAFNQDIGDWDVINAKHMEYMFKNAKAFNQNIGGWNTSNVTTINNMFQDAIVFNQPIGALNLSNVEVMNNLFDGAIAFNQEIRSWTLNDDANVDGGCYNELLKGATAFHTAFGTSDTTGREFFTQTKAELKAATLEFNQMDKGSNGYDAAKEAAAEAKYGRFSNLYTKSDDMSYLFKPDPVSSSHGEINEFFNSGTFTGGSNTENPRIDLTFKTEAQNPDFDVGGSTDYVHGFLTRTTYMYSAEQWVQIDISNLQNGFDYRGGTMNILGNWISEWNYKDVTDKTQADPLKITQTYGRASGEILTSTYYWDPATQSFGYDDPTVEAPPPSLDFNRSIATWNNLQQVTSIEGMLENAVGYNQPFPINMSNVVNVKNLFKGASSFDQYVDFAKFGTITDLTSVFEGATAFSQILSYDASNVTSLYRSFMGTSIAGITLSSTNTNPVLTNLESTFENCSSLATFNISVLLTNVTTAKNLFKNCASLNNDVTLVSDELTTVESVLEGCSSFNSNVVLNSPKLVDVTNALTGATSMSGDITATVPALTQDLRNVLQDCKSVYNGIFTLDAATLTSVEALFMNCTNLNKAPVLTVLAATSAKDLFKGCTALNTDISLSLLEVTNVESAFEGCTALNTVQTLTLPLATIAKNLFKGCTAFNQLLTLELPEVTTYQGALEGCTDFNSSLTIDGPKVTDVKDLLKGCTSFNNAFILDAATLPSIEGLFMNLVALNTAPTLTVPLVTNAKDLFKNCTAFDQDLSLNLPEATTYESVLEGCTSFNKNVDLTTSNVTNMKNMFKNCVSFTTKLDMDTTNVTTMESMLEGCVVYDQNLIGLTNTSNVTTMKNMLKGCKLFNKNIESLEAVSVTDMEGMFEGCELYDHCLEDLDTANVTNMKNLLKDCVKYNKCIGALNVQNVTTMEGMFEGCSEFNQCVDFGGCMNDEGTANVKSFKHFLKDCIEYDQCIDELNMSRATDVEGMFMGCTSFNQTLPDIPNHETLVEVDRVTYIERTNAFGPTTGEACVQMYIDGNYVTRPLLHSTLLRSDYPDLSDIEFMKLGVVKISEIRSVSNNPKACLYYENSASLNLQTHLNNINKTNNLPSTINLSDKHEITIDDETKRLHDLVLHSKEHSIGDPIEKIDFYVTGSPDFADSTVIFTEFMSPYNYINLVANYGMFGDLYLYENSSDIDIIEAKVIYVINTFGFKWSPDYGPIVGDINDQYFPIFGVRPQGITSLQNFLKGCTSFNKDLHDGIDTSLVTTMESMLEGATSYNLPLEGLDTSNVTTMKNMLKGAAAFNQPLGELDTSLVTTMESMLEGCYFF